MAIIETNLQWSAPVVLATKSILQCHGGHPGYVALGSTGPTGQTDGLFFPDHGAIPLPAGVTVRFRTAAGDGEFYVGPAE